MFTNGHQQAVDRTPSALCPLPSAFLLNPPPIKDHQIAHFGGGLYPYWRNLQGVQKSKFSRVRPHTPQIAPYTLVLVMNQLPPLFTNTPEEIVPATTLAEFPVNTFLENIATDTQGNLFITSYEEGKIYRVTTTGVINEYANIDGNAAGIVFARQGDVLVAGATSDKTATVFRLNGNGAIETLVTIPDAIFLNGMTPLVENRYLIADSYKGAIWEVNVVEKTARIWLQHERLARSNPNHPFPAVNGLKIYNNTLYATNTQRQHLIRIPINSDYTAGTPELFLSNVNLDDFAFDIDGNVYATTHVYNSVVKITPEGKVTTIAKAKQGVAGSTALAFGRTASDCTAIYVVTNGGMSLPLPSGLEPAKVIRLEVAIQGLVTSLRDNS